MHVGLVVGSVRRAYLVSKLESRREPLARGKVVMALLERLPRDLENRVKAKWGFTGMTNVPTHVSWDQLVASVDAIVADMLSNPQTKAYEGLIAKPKKTPTPPTPSASAPKGAMSGSKGATKPSSAAPAPTHTEKAGAASASVPNARKPGCGNCQSKTHDPHSLASCHIRKCRWAALPEGCSMAASGRCTFEPCASNFTSKHASQSISKSLPARGTRLLRPTELSI
jgi:hypothetical protein